MSAGEKQLLQISLDLPDEAASVPVCRKAVRAVLHDLNVDSLRALDIETAVGEAAANVVRHAYSQPGNRYRVSVTIYADHVCLQVKDNGRGFNRASLSDPSGEQVGGWGIWLIEQMADQAAFHCCDDSGALLEASFFLSRPATLPEEPPRL
jgi:anti-sigma regulatory factor (Ser/Thr protein kinase)